MGLVGLDLTLEYAFLTRAGLLYRLYTQPNTSPHTRISTETSPTKTLAIIRSYKLQIAKECKSFYVHFFETVLHKFIHVT